MAPVTKNRERNKVRRNTSNSYQLKSPKKRKVIDVKPVQNLEINMISFANNLLRELGHVFEMNKNPKDAIKMKQYMRNQFEYYGIKTPLRRKLQNDLIKKYKPENSHQVQIVLELCWNETYRDFRLFGLDYTKKYNEIFASGNSADCLNFLYKTIKNEPWWDIVDMMASCNLGYLVKKYSLQSDMDKWIQDESLWIRRAALLHQLQYKHETNVFQLLQHCKSLAKEKDFFIRKAIGWALRNYGRFNPDVVRNFVEENENLLSNLSKREALKHL